MFSLTFGKNFLLLIIGKLAPVEEEVEKEKIKEKVPPPKTRSYPWYYSCAIKHSSLDYEKHCTEGGGHHDSFTRIKQNEIQLKNIRP